MCKEERFLKPEEDAELLRVHRLTVTGWIWAGRVERLRVGKLWNVPEGEA